ncbi:unnamed protein product [Ectocarpus sp. 8 AP-2014]
MAGSATEQFRPCRRVLTPGFSGTEQARPQGLARIEASPRVTPRPTGLRTNAKASRRSGYDIPDPGLVLQSKHVVMDDTGRPAKERVSEELTLEKAFGLKRKVNSQREKRGGVPAKANPGDKLFHHVDYSPGYHKTGEIIVGSSFYRTRDRGGSGHVGPGQASRPPPVPEEVGYALAYRKPKMTFNETRQAAQYVEDLRGVLGLTEEAPVPEAAAGHEAGASWEERTGMHTWKKKEKSPPDSASVEGVAEGATAGK